MAADQATRELRGRIIRISALSVLIIALIGGAAAFWVLHTQSSIVVVHGESMEPTLHNGEMFFMDQAKEMKIGQIAVLPKPKTWTDENAPTSNLVKRIAALPGDTILYDGHKIFVNGNVSYDLTADDYVCGNGPVNYSHKLTKNEVFVMGDNHKNSGDSLNVFCNGDTQDIYISKKTVIAYGTKERNFPW